MQNEVKSANELQPGDIIFDCPQCGKSLAIDVRGAGYIVRCPDCGAEIQVPGIDTVAKAPTVDATPAAAPEPSTPEARLEHLERQRAADRERLQQISGELALIQAALDRVMGLIADANAGENSTGA